MSRIRRWLWKTARTVHLCSTLFGVTLLTFFAVTGFMLNHEHWFIDPQKEPRVVEGTVPAEMVNPINGLAIENMLRRDYGATGPLQPVDLEENPLQFRFLRPGGRVEARVKPRGNLKLVYFEEEPRVVYEAIPTERFTPVDAEAIEKLLRDDHGATGDLEPVNLLANPLVFRFGGPDGKMEATIETQGFPAELHVIHYDDGAAGILVDLHKGKNTGRVWKLVIDAVCILMLIVAITGLVLWRSLRGRGRFNSVVLVIGVGVGFAVYFFFVPR